jgi:hypothetical protein
MCMINRYYTHWETLNQGIFHDVQKTLEKVWEGLSLAITHNVIFNFGIQRVVCQ